MRRRAGEADRAGLGRGPLTRWLPVLGQAPARAPEVAPFVVDATVTPIRFTLRVLSSIKRLTIPAAVLSAVHWVGEALVPVVMGLAIDRALEAGDAAQLLVWLLVLGSTFLIISLAFRFGVLLTTRAVQLLQHRLRVTLSTQVLHPAGAGVRRIDGGVLSTITNDAGRLSTSVGLFVHPVGELAGIAFTTGALVVIHCPLGLAAVLGIPVVVWSMVALSGPSARSRQAYQTLLAGTVGEATDLVAGYRVIKGVRAEREAARRYRRASREALAGAHRNIGVLGRFLATTNTISAVFVAGLTGLAGWLAVDGRITVGQLIAAAGLTQALLPPLTMLTANAGASWASAVASGGRILDLLTEATPVPSDRDDLVAGATLAPVPTVELRVPGQDALRIEPGELVGVRTDDRTAAQVAVALLDPSGAGDVQVHLDGIAAGRIEGVAYREHIVVAPHAVTLFSGTIADNLDVPGARPGRWAAALRAAACEDVVSALDDGLDSQIGEDGNRLSGGQRQRLALARALARDAPLLVLHDPTTAVDSVTEAAIAARLPDIRRGRSTLVIASSPALLGVCDRVVDLQPILEVRRAEANVL